MLKKNNNNKELDDCDETRIGLEQGVHVGDGGLGD